MPAKRHNGSSSARGRPRGSRRGRSNIGRHTRDTKARRESRANLSAEQVDEIRERNRVAHQEARANLSQERADEIRRVDREAHRQARANLSQRRAKEMRHADREAHQQARVNLSQGRPDGIRHVDRESHQQDRENISQERAAKIRDANRVVHQEARTNSSQGRADEIKQADRESHQQARAIFTDGELEILRESDRLAHERSRREMNEIELLMVRQGDVIRRRLGIPINIRDREGEVREKLIHCVEGRRVRNVESIVIRRAEAMANMTDEERIEATCLRRARTHENVKNKNHILSEGNQDQNRIVKRDDLVDVKDYSCVKNGFAEPTVQSLKTEGTQSLLQSLSHNGDEHNAPGFLEKLDQGRPFINGKLVIEYSLKLVNISSADVNLLLN